MLGLRALANVFVTQNGIMLVQNEAKDIVEALKRLDPEKLNKNGRIARATVVLKWVVLLLNPPYFFDYRYEHELVMLMFLSWLLLSFA